MSASPRSASSVSSAHASGVSSPRGREKKTRESEETASPTVASRDAFFRSKDVWAEQRDHRRAHSREGEEERGLASPSLGPADGDAEKERVSTGSTGGGQTRVADLQAPEARRHRPASSPPLASPRAPPSTVSSPPLASPRAQGLPCSS
ncbi:hypothetical protein TGPRC2_423910 [Toxoplasma gondii TgCatPRC2]|uniref:Uncharacterized protein n=1 Tax=Toxoplasma gondii TgCatPRC2 TaxID=1130821 RepID=A0A151HKB3_TOXGO|nr:hypothetical protein TGPRC2_423910 [Toxoplasma gondii TgCatPRC2]